MKVSRIVVLCAAMCVAGVAVAGAQGRGASQRPAKPATPATHAPRGPQGPKAAGTTGRQNDRPKPAQAARGAEKSNAEKSEAARGADKSGEARGGDRSIAANIAKSPQLEARLKAMLPSGMTMDQASDGFRNQGQFIAALEASKNQNIDFVKLKAEMTGDDALSLGQAVQKLKPAEAKPATAQ